MKTITQNPDKTVAALIHLSTFSQFFFPFGNFIIPLILWTAKKEDRFVDEHGKQALNFQISIFLYFIILLCIGIVGVIFIGLDINSQGPLVIGEHYVRLEEAAQFLPFIIFLSIIGLLMIGLLIFQIFFVITATVKASEGSLFSYPLTINFIKPSLFEENQSKNEQFNNTQI